MLPQSFINYFRRRLHSADVRFLITSGQACVYYGIQQTTKDSDWIIEPDDLGKLLEMLQAIDGSEVNRVSFRPICGAPMTKQFFKQGWTSHLQITDADGDDQYLDFFGKPPRVTVWERDVDDSDYAARQVVAQMKKTDREKDWPFVFALGKQAVTLGDPRGILHGQDVDWLIQTWTEVPQLQRDEFILLRPLLRLIVSQPKQLRRALMIEKFLWQSINTSRYRVYQQAWKVFFRQWRREPNFHWPGSDHFKNQCEILNAAASRYGLLTTPLSDDGKAAALAQANKDAIEIFAATADELNQIVPPLELMLP